MKLSQLEARIARIKSKLPKGADPKVVVDLDENGFYDLEGVNPEFDEDDNLVINLRSSNEA